MRFVTFKQFQELQILDILFQFSNTLDISNSWTGYNTESCQFKLLQFNRTQHQQPSSSNAVIVVIYLAAVKSPDYLKLQLYTRLSESSGINLCNIDKFFHVLIDQYPLNAFKYFFMNQIFEY
ncbi:unnamed protein product [Paramecium octaurelia]|uniref:Uncharacterized protein n=1 Tax=Paramecium octaurelia TaxID=43137 RepID=A0A8S1V269_PAROT|nr:unnamed protein product [Paramecium octaurelia]